MPARSRRPRWSRRSRWVVACLLAAPVAAALSGCAGAAGLALSAAAPVISDVISPGRKTPQVAPDTAGLGPLAGRAQRDAGRFWQREILGSDGTPFSLASARPGEAIAVRWRVPFTVTGTVEAVAGLGDAACLAREALAPATWTLEADAGAPGEAWRVGGVTEPGRRVLGRLPAEALGGELGVDRSHRVAWLLIVPAPGTYRLVVEYRGTDPEQALDAAPCLAAWLPVPLPTAIAVTLPAGARPVPTATVQVAAPSRFAGGRPGPSAWRQDGTGILPRPAPPADAASSTSAPGLVMAATPDSLVDASPIAARLPTAPAAAPSTPLDVVRAAYALLDTPSYDVVRLFQVAIAAELDAPVVPPLSAAATAEAVRTWRARHLVRLQTPASRSELCRLVMRPGLADRPLRLWGGEATVPAAIAATCAPDR